MKIKEGFMLRRLGNGYAAVAMGKARKEFNGLIRMNETGKFLWDCLKKGCTEDELVQYLMEEFEVPEEEARKDAGEFAAKLENAGILA